MVETANALHTTPDPEQRQILNDIYSKLLKDISIDFTNLEIIDIQTAVHKMIERVVARVNDRGIFSVARIQPAGSMADKTALWKYDLVSMADKTALWKYDLVTAEYSIEFDYLAVLKNTIEHYCQEEPTLLYSRVKEQNVLQEPDDCIGCKLVKAPEELERMKKCFNSDHIRIIDPRFVFNEQFLIQINRCLASSCDCLSVSFDPPKYGYTITFQSASSEHARGCDECTIDMPTGTLSVNTSTSISRHLDAPLKCSLVLLWTSKARSLMPSCGLLLPETQKIRSLPSFVDFLPVVEALKPTFQGKGHEHDYFIVPKGCNVGGLLCDGWRKSWCMAEMNAFKCMSDKHRQCYQILKCHIAVKMLYDIDYHVKTIALHHSASCSNTTSDVVDCVREMVHELQNAYESGTLKQFQEPRINLLLEGGRKLLLTEYFTRRLIDKLDSLPNFDYIWKYIESLPKEKLLKIVPASQQTQSTDRNK